jgi:hypothetical protein
MVNGTIKPTESIVVEEEIKQDKDREVVMLSMWVYQDVMRKRKGSESNVNAIDFKDKQYPEPNILLVCRRIELIN